jgi:tetratricopeptide (TPR) repeat protein
MRESPANRPAPTASGSFAKTPLVHLLVYALEHKLDGTIEVTTPAPKGAVPSEADGRKAQIVFRAGQPAKVRADEASLQLGRVLVELRHLPEAEVARALTQQGAAPATERPLLGDVLVASGVITPAQRDAGLREQMARSLRHVAAAPGDASYAFYAGFDALTAWGAPDSAGADPLPMLWRMLRESPPRVHVDAALDRIGQNPLRLVRNPQLDRLDLGRGQRAAAEATRAHPATVVDLVRTSQLGPDDARLFVYLLLLTKQVDVLQPTQAARVEARSASSSPAPPQSAPVAPAPPPKRTSPPAGAVAAARAPSGTPVLKPPPAASATRHNTPSSIPPLPPLEFPDPPAGLSPEHAARWTEVVERAQRIDRSDYFAMLDLARDATAPEIQAAFLHLAKRWHPDRLPAELAPLRDACSRVFARMSEANATLSDEERRTRYMRLMAEGTGSPEMQEQVARIIDGASKFQKAEVCFKRQDYAQAEQYCRKALKADPTQPDYHAMHAWLLSMKPEYQSPEKVVECIEELDTAVGLSDRCERAFYWRGLLHKRLGKHMMAQRDFKRVVEINPRNIDAAREVRLYQMRGGVPADEAPAAPPKAQDTGKSAGLLGRFFKKS